MTDTRAAEICEQLRISREERRKTELQWLLNSDFMAGRQYSRITAAGRIEEERCGRVTEGRRVFNHIAPIIETRLSKLARIEPSMSVRASGTEEADAETARLATKILAAVMGDADFSDVTAKACCLSEICGTAFYKIIWNADGGDGGTASVVAVSPFEIYPESLLTENVEGQPSIIHAKAIPVSEIRDRWGIELAGRNVEVFGGGGDCGGILRDAELVIERYERAGSEHPDGRLEIVAGEQLVYSGPLPYLNGKNGGRAYPFVKQTALQNTGNFFGTSLIERLIPIQRAYNGVKNRKYEYIDRVTAGVLRVEDGSVDADMLQEEGISPGSVLVYRQGAQPPTVLENVTVPSDFAREEDRLLDEFVLISGVSELTRATSYYGENSSGAALRILSEIEDTKLLITVESMKRAVKETARQILRLCKQFVSGDKLMRISGDRGRVEVFHFTGSDIGSDDVVWCSDSDYSRSLSERREFALELLRSGLLTGKDGSLDSRMRAKLLDVIGFGAWEETQDSACAHLNKAAYENLLSEIPPPIWVDDHALHIDEHIKHLLNRQTATGKLTKKLLEHIEMHRDMLSEEVAVEQR